VIPERIIFVSRGITVLRSSEHGKENVDVVAVNISFQRTILHGRIVVRTKTTMECVFILIQAVPNPNSNHIPDTRFLSDKIFSG